MKGQLCKHAKLTRASLILAKCGRTHALADCMLLGLRCCPLCPGRFADAVGNVRRTMVKACCRCEEFDVGEG